MIRTILNIGLILLSMVCVFTSPAVFTASFFLALVLIASSGIVAIYGNLQIAIIMLFLNIIAVNLSPFKIMEVFGGSLFLFSFFILPFVIGFGGTMIGVKKLQRLC